MAKKKRKKSPPPRKLSLPACAAVLAMLTICVIAFAWSSINKRVSTVLSNPLADSDSAIYSDAFAIRSENLPAPSILKEQLIRRHYRQVEQTPRFPGEFRIQGSLFDIYVRELTHLSNEPRAAHKIRIDFEKASLIEPGSETSLSEAQLEPAPLSNLDPSDLRAAENKPLSAIPLVAQQAVIAIEDSRFYSHHGVDLAGILRALWVNLSSMRISQGGSTLTQQLAKNLLFSPERTISRKFKEIIAALALEQRLSKSEILEMYLNEVYLGQEGAVALHGIPQAASSFFGKRVEDLSLAEAATIAGIIQAPSLYSPRRHPDRAIKRRNLVLQRMEEEGFIKTADLRAALHTKLNIVKEPAHRREAPHFIAALRKELSERLGDDAALTQGERIETGLDLHAQRCAEYAVERGLSDLEKHYPRFRRGKRLEAALVSLEPFSGKVRAWVRGRDFGKSQFDRVDQARRQIGSTIKPFVYLTALDSKLNSYKAATTTTILPDRPMQFDIPNQSTWEPENFDHEFRGEVTLRYALENSLNIPAAYIAQRVGLHAVATTLHKFHVSDGTIPEVPALALGSLDTTLLSLTAAYAAIANGGQYVQPRLFLRVADSDGETILREEIKEERLVDEGPVFVLTNILQGVVERGTGTAARRYGFRGNAAGKTGTSNESRDAWFVGFTPNLATGVWVGLDDNTMIDLTGGKAAAPIWGDYMHCVSGEIAESTFVAPRDVQWIDIDADSGALATPECPRERVVREIFVTGTQPQTGCPLHGAVSIPSFPGTAETTPPSPRRKRSIWDMLFG
ncbi:MAG: PBP1A family penicillin-binding protein [Oligoflexia bacterium]|nr:PBP1A family penicillin-binding protein [Oligoflexia bacterium]